MEYVDCVPIRLGESSIFCPGIRGETIRFSITITIRSRARLHYTIWLVGWITQKGLFIARDSVIFLSVRAGDQGNRMEMPSKRQHWSGVGILTEAWPKFRLKYVFPSSKFNEQGHFVFSSLSTITGDLSPKKGAGGRGFVSWLIALSIGIIKASAGTPSPEKGISVWNWKRAIFQWLVVRKEGLALMVCFPTYFMTHSGSKSKHRFIGLWLSRLSSFDSQRNPTLKWWSACSPC